MPYSNISAVLAEADQLTILTKINEIKALLPFLVNLQQEERSVMLKMGDKSVPFVEKALGYSQSTPNLVPPYIDPAELKKDVELVQRLTPVFNAIAQLYESLDDTVMAVGSEAFSAALAVYNTSREATKANVPGIKSIYEDLKLRFPGRPGKTTPPVPPTP